MTAVFMVIDGESNNAFYLNAGHDPIMIKIKGEITPKINPSSPLGFVQEAFPKVERLEFGEGDAIFLYTDGIFTNQSKEGKKLKKVRIRKLFEETKEIELFKNTLVDRMELWFDNQEDDATFLVLKRAALSSKKQHQAG